MSGEPAIQPIVYRLKISALFIIIPRSYKFEKVSNADPPATGKLCAARSITALQKRPPGNRIPQDEVAGNSSEFIRGVQMKNRLLIALIAAMILTMIPIANDRALAEENQPARGLMFAALSPSGESCEQSGIKSTTGAPALACRSAIHAPKNKSMAAVSCGSNQWCCKHDDFSKGTCVKCCSK